MPPQISPSSPQTECALEHEFSHRELIYTRSAPPRGNGSVLRGRLPRHSAGEGRGSVGNTTMCRPSGPSHSFPNCRDCWLLTAHSQVPLQGIAFCQRMWSFLWGQPASKVWDPEPQAPSLSWDGSVGLSSSRVHWRLGPAEASVTIASHLNFSLCPIRLPSLPNRSSFLSSLYQRAKSFSKIAQVDVPTSY